MNFGADLVTVRNTGGILSGKMAFVLASLVFVSAIFFMFILQEYRSMKILNMEEGIKNENLDKKRQTLTKMKSFERKVESINKEEVEKIDKFIPSDDKVEFELSNLDISGRVAEVGIKNMKIEKVAKTSKKDGDMDVKLQSGNVDTVLYSFDVSGKYSNIKRFITSIEQSIPLMTIKSLVMKSDEKEDEEVEPAKTDKQIIANISVESYYYQSNQNK